MIIDFKTFMNEGRSNWWLKKPVSYDQGVLFKTYKKYDRFFIKLPGITRRYEILSNRIESASFGQYFELNDIDILKDVIVPFNEDTIEKFFEEVYGYEVYIFDIESFPRYKFNDMEAANRLINKINDAIKDKFGYEYGIFPTN